MGEKQVSLCAGLARVSLCSHLPTPLEKMQRLSDQVGGPEIWVKREDLTGLALGGNKIRNHEFIFGEMLAQGCDTVITTAGVQSNMCRATAAAAAKLGLKCVLLLRGTGDEPQQGNLLLDDLLGADVRFIATQDPYDPRVGVWLDEVKAEWEQTGKKPYVLHLTGATGALATCAYVDAAQELVQQFDEVGIHPDYIFVTTGSGITAAGLALGLKHLGRKTRVVGVSSAAPSAFLKTRIVDCATGAAVKLNLETRVTPSDFEVLDAYIGPGYGHSYPEVHKTIRRVAQTEGVLLDPVYTGKCFTGLLDQIEKGLVTKDQQVVFLHSGGAPNLFVRNET
jgi:D-cysteine desulfhydrase family pyridoxal phosphate-dependent enzyme